MTKNLQKIIQIIKAEKSNNLKILKLKSMEEKNCTRNMKNRIYIFLNNLSRFLKFILIFSYANNSILKGFCSNKGEPINEENKNNPEQTNSEIIDQILKEDIEKFENFFESLHTYNFENAVEKLCYNMGQLYAMNDFKIVSFSLKSKKIREFDIIKSLLKINFTDEPRSYIVRKLELKFYITKNYDIQNISEQLKNHIDDPIIENNLRNAIKNFCLNIATKLYDNVTNFNEVQKLNLTHTDIINFIKDYNIVGLFTKNPFKTKSIFELKFCSILHFWIMLHYTEFSDNEIDFFNSGKLSIEWASKTFENNIKKIEYFHDKIISDPLYIKLYF